MSLVNPNEYRALILSKTSPYLGSARAIESGSCWETTWHVSRELQEVLIVLFLVLRHELVGRLANDLCLQVQVSPKLKISGAVGVHNSKCAVANQGVYLEKGGKLSRTMTCSNGINAHRAGAIT
jgi:hypothetical protein